MTTHPQPINTTYLWRGLGGTLVTGPAIADHLTRTLELLDRDGWTRTYQPPPSTLHKHFDGITTSSPLRAQFGALFSVVRDYFAPSDDTARPRTVADASYKTSVTDTDTDTSHAAERLLERLIQARTLAHYVSLGPWANRRDRTWEDIRSLFQEGIDFALANGPASTDGPPPPCSDPAHGILIRHTTRTGAFVTVLAAAGTTAHAICAGCQEYHPTADSNDLSAWAQAHAAKCGSSWAATALTSR